MYAVTANDPYFELNSDYRFRSRSYRHYHLCRSQTLLSKDQKYIEAAEMWCYYRRLLGISWTKHKTNECVLEHLDIEKELLRKVKSTKMSYYGHVVRN